MSAEIYIAGANTDSDLAEELEEDYPEQTFLTGDSDVDSNPAEVVSAAYEVLGEADGLLVAHDDESDYVTDVLVRTAYKEGIPTVVWNDSGEKVAPWLAYHTRYVDDRREQAVPCLLMYAGVSAEEVISKG